MPYSSLLTQSYTPYRFFLCPSSGSLLTRDVETVAVKCLEQAGQSLEQFIRRRHLRIGRHVVVNDAGVGTPAGEFVVVVCRTKVDNDLDVRIPLCVPF